MLSSDKKVWVATWVIRRPKWLPDWKWSVIPAFAALIAIAGYGFVWEQSPPTLHHQYEQTNSTKPEASQSAADVGRADLSNKIIAHYTRTLAFVTAVLAVVGMVGFVISCVQIYYLHQSDRRAAEAAKLAGQQFALIGLQTEHIERQKELSRLQYYAQNRPKLVIKDVFFNLEGGLNFEVANIGGITATITDGWAAVDHIADDRWFKIRNYGHLLVENLNGRTFSAGEFKVLTLINTVDIADELLSPLDFLDRDVSNLFFFGAFHYVDDRGEEFGTMRLAVFRRQWMRDVMAFQRTEGPDHEYSD